MKTALPWLVILASTAVAGCDTGPTHLVGTPDGDGPPETSDAEPDLAPETAADADVPVEGEAEAGADLSAEADAEAEDGEADVEAMIECQACLNEPTDGPAGDPCTDAADCEEGFECFPESVEMYGDEAYVYWPGGYCASYGAGTEACDPYEPRSCPRGSQCIYVGEGVGGEAYGCFDVCAVASREGVPWESNCDCRDGYVCDLGSELCFTGCSNDRECCEIWIDENENGRRSEGEVTLLGPERCTDVCDRCTWSCTRDGCPGGDCEMGGPCEHDSDCPAGATCWSEAQGGAEYAPGGLCILERCDLVGRECPDGSGCVNLGNYYDPAWYCLTPCTPGTDPGSPGYPCRDADPPGPSAGDYACMPTDPSSWYDETAAEGYCWAGRYPGGSGPIGSPCEDTSDCVSPHGLGLCADWAGPGFCTVMCSEATAEAALCEIDPVSAEATGACYYSICLQTCGTPEAPLGENGCDNPDLACYRARFFAGYLYYAEGRTEPDGICWVACTSDASCVESWGPGYTCDRDSGVCLR